MRNTLLPFALLSLLVQGATAGEVDPVILTNRIDNLAVLNIPEAQRYTLVYSLDLPDQAFYNETGVPYSLDLHSTVRPGTFSRVAYYLEVQTGDDPVQYVWASMDAFTTDAAKIGVPTVGSGAFFQMPVTNLVVHSTVPGVRDGTWVDGGNIEFWPTDYSQGNKAALPGASDYLYDWGDTPLTTVASGYGSMQVHNHAQEQTVFAFNGWGGKGTVCDLGIGNWSEGDPDWTGAQNAAEYVAKRLQVYVLSGVPWEFEVTSANVVPQTGLQSGTDVSSLTRGADPARHSRSNRPSIGLMGLTPANFIDFDGVDDYVDCGSVPNTTGDLTVAAWINTRSQTVNQRIVDNGGTIVYCTTYPTQAIELDSAGGAGGWSGTSVIPTNTWIHVVVTRTSTGFANFYINGVLTGAPNQTTVTNFTPTHNLYIGNRPGLDRPFNGYLEDVRLYNRVLSSREVSSLYNCRCTRSTAIGGLVGFWPLDDGTDGTSANGATCTDRSGAGHNGTAHAGTNGTGCTWRAGGPLSSSNPTCYAPASMIEFDGVDDYVNAGSVANTDGDLTITAWIFTRSQTVNQRIVDNGGTILYCTTLGGIELDNAAGSGTGSANSAFATNTWVHVAMTRTAAGSCNFFINGSLSGPANQSLSPPFTPTQNLYIANRVAGGRAFNGYMEDVRMYSRVLSSGEISTVYNCLTPHSFVTTGLVAYWPLDDGQASLTANGATVADISGQGNTGTGNWGSNGSGCTWRTGGPLTSNASCSSPASAIEFDGVDDNINSGSVANTTGDLTITAWMYARSLSTNQRILDNGGTIFFCNTGTGAIELDNASGGAAISANSAFATNTWVHVAVTRTSSGIVNLYVNGALSGTANQSMSVSFTPTTSLYIGNRSALDRPFSGYLEEVRLYNRILTGAELTAVYNNRTPHLPVTSNLIAYWPLDDGPVGVGANGASCVDFSGDGNVGRASYGSNSSGCTWRAVGPFAFNPPACATQGASLEFDGTDDSVNCGSVTGTTGDVTVAAWIYSRASSINQRIVGNGGTDFFCNTGTGAIELDNASGGGAISANNAFQTNTWVHVLVTRTSGGTANLYVDGALSGTPNQSMAGSYTATTSLYIGNRAAGDRAFNGYIADVRIYNRVLSAAEIVDLYETRTPHSTAISGLVGYWPLDDGCDNTSAVGASCSDLSGGGHSGTPSEGSNAFGAMWRALGPFTPGAESSGGSLQILITEPKSTSNIP